MRTISIIFSDDIRRKFKSISILFPIMGFLIFPLIYLSIFFYIQFPNSLFGNINSTDLFEFLNLANFFMFYYIFTLFGIIYATIEGCSFFAPKFKDGTMKIFLSLPIRRIELFTSKVMEFVFTLMIFSLLGMILPNFIFSLFCTQPIAPFILFLPRLLIYWLMTILLLTSIYSMTTLFNMLLSNKVSILISLSLFLFFPFFLWNLIFNGIYLITVFGMDEIVYLQIIDLSLFFRLDYHAISVILNIFPELYEISFGDPSLNLSYLIQGLLYVEGVYNAIAKLITFTVIPLGSSLLLFLYKDIKD